MAWDYGRDPLCKEYWQGGHDVEGYVDAQAF